MKLTKKRNLGRKNYKRHDIEVENTKNFVASGVVVHNSNIRIGYCLDTNESGNAEFTLMVGSHNTRRKQFDKECRPNEYWSVLTRYPQLEQAAKDLSNNCSNVIIYGELLGTQDMMYNCKPGEKDLRIFDIKVDEKYLNWYTVVDICQQYGLPTVPELYVGKYNPDVIKQLTDGPTLICEKPNSKFKGREGVVFKLLNESSHPKLGRMILKSVSVDYLSRRGGTDGH